MQATHECARQSSCLPHSCIACISYGVLLLRITSDFVLRLVESFFLLMHPGRGCLEMSPKFANLFALKLELLSHLPLPHLSSPLLISDLGLQLFRDVQLMMEAEAGLVQYSLKLHGLIVHGVVGTTWVAHPTCNVGDLRP